MKIILRSILLAVFFTFSAWQSNATHVAAADIFMNILADYSISYIWFYIVIVKY